jgi:hypothetical protein
MFVCPLSELKNSVVGERLMLMAVAALRRELNISFKILLKAALPLVKWNKPCGCVIASPSHINAARVEL